MTLSEMKTSSEENIVHKNSQNAGHDDGANTGVVTLHGHVTTNESLKDLQASDADTNSNQDSDSDIDEADDTVDLSCGIWKFRTTILGTWFTNLYSFSIIVGLSSMFAFMSRRIVSVQLESLEKQFNINNTYAGLFETTSKIGLIATILFSGHFTRKVHIPVIVGISGIIQGLLLIAPAVLQFVDPYTLPVLTYGNQSNGSHESDKYMCGATIINETANGTTLSPNTNKSEDISQTALILVLVVLTLKGVTESFHTHYLPTVYVDDNMLDKTKMSFFLGIRFFIDGLSGPLGTEINGIITEVPIDLKKTDMDPKDGRFVAAWWLAFLVCGAGLVVTSFPLLLFPKTLVSEKQRLRALRRAKVVYAGGVAEENEQKPRTAERKVSVPRIVLEEEGQESKDLSDHTDGTNGHLKHLYERKGSVASVNVPMARKLSLFPPLEGPTERKVSLSGDIVFDQPVKSKPGDKPNESAFKELIKDLPKSFLRLMKTPMFVLSIIDICAISIPLSGMYMFRNVYMTMEYNVAMSEVALATSVTSAIGSMTGSVIASWLCTKANSKLALQWIIMGTYFVQLAVNPLFLIFGCDNKSVYGASGSIGLPINLTAGCDCTYSKQLLSCGDDGNNYLSPCHAGCTGVNGKIFTDCIGLVNTSFGTTVTPGVCSSECHTNFLIYAILHGVQYMVEGGTMIPRWLLILRVVEPQDRGFATSFYIFFYNIMSIPSSNVFGKFIDNACFIWDGQLCNLYNRDTIRYLMSGLDVGVNLLSVVTNFPMIIILWLELRKTRRETKKEKDDDKDDKKDKENAITDEVNDNTKPETEIYQF
ncbi:solute carrier organic anion transporter family member 2A1-like isoform X1 [Biomphalaria glabrata]|nr:solute carrier organic anion transporter family member 2A1-like isoform X1 [Biomphalaria glabrata]